MANTAIIVAAGESRRFGGEEPKQFVNILGRPLVFHTLAKFQTCESIHEIVLVMSADGLQRIGDGLSSSFPKLSTCVLGGRTRAHSVENGLQAVSSSTEYVAIHDGARPLVTPAEISATLEKAEEVGAACLVTEMTDTIKRVSGGRIIETLERSQLRRALTPQAFRLDVIRRAFEEIDLDESFTDDCYLVEKLGLPIAYVEGSSRNIKVTRPDDLLLVEAVLRHG